MIDKIKLEKQIRLREIEDRKIEILLDIVRINDKYSEKISQLNSEYVLLDDEYYHIKLELIMAK